MTDDHTSSLRAPASAWPPPVPVAATAADRRALTGNKLRAAQEMYGSKKYTVAAIAKTLGVSRASIYRHLTRVGG